MILAQCCVVPQFVHGSPAVLVLSVDVPCFWSSASRKSSSSDLVLTTMGHIVQKTQQQTNLQPTITLSNHPSSVQSEGTMPDFEMEDCQLNSAVSCDYEKSGFASKTTIDHVSGHRSLFFVVF